MVHGVLPVPSHFFTPFVVLGQHRCQLAGNPEDEVDSLGLPWANAASCLHLPASFQKCLVRFSVPHPCYALEAEVLILITLHEKVLLTACTDEETEA